MRIHYEKMIGDRGYSVIVDNTDIKYEDDLTVKAQDINMKAGLEGLSITTRMTVTADDTIGVQSFTLYRDFIVSQVLVDGQPASFRQSLDAVWVQFPHTLTRGTQAEITFTYAGKSSPLLEVNESTVQLYDQFPWLPWPGVYLERRWSFYLMPLEQVNHDTVEYTLSYQGPGGVYVNVPIQSDGSYHGESATGLMVYSGMMNIHYGDTTLYIPPALAARANEFMALADSQTSSYNRTLDLISWLLTTQELEAAKEKYDASGTKQVCIIENSLDAGSVIQPPKRGNTIVMIFGNSIMAMDEAQTETAHSLFLGDKGSYPVLSHVLFEMSNSSYGNYPFLEFIGPYCAYRSGDVSKDEFIQKLPYDKNAKALIESAQKLTKLITVTPREKVDEFIRTWFDKIKQQNPPYKNYEEVYQALKSFLGTPQ